MLRLAARTVLFLFFLPAPLFAQPVTRIVDDDGQGTATSCEAPTPASTTVDAAIGAAGAGDTVLVCPGTYVENINFRGKAITVRSVGGPAVTILDGNAAGGGRLSFGGVCAQHRDEYLQCRSDRHDHRCADALISRR